MNPQCRWLNQPADLRPPTTTALPEISIILCTRNRAESLGRCLGHYENIRTAASWELVVVNNGSTDETATVLEHHYRRNTIPLVILSEPKTGLSNARNTGLRQARGNILCFSDDDCYPDPEFVDAWLNAFRDPTIDFGGGRIELFDPSDAEVTLKTDAQPFLIPPRSLISPGTLHGASLAFRRHVVEAIGWFDSDLGAGSRFKSGEDSEYVQRASEWGFSGLYTPNPLVWHHHGRKHADVPALAVGYQIGWGAFYVNLLTRNPCIVWRGIVKDFSESQNAIFYAKLLYWRSRRWSLPRVWNVLRGAAGFSLVKVRRTRKSFKHVLPIVGKGGEY